MTLKSDAKFKKKTDTWFEIWHEECGEFSPNHSEVWKFHLDGLFLFKFLSLRNTEEWSIIALNSDKKFE